MDALKPWTINALEYSLLFDIGYCDKGFNNQVPLTVSNTDMLC